MGTSQIASYLLDVFGLDNQVEVARRLGVDRTNLHRKLTTDKGPFYAIEVARAYGLNVVDTLVKAGWLQASEVANGLSLADATDQQLSEEILRRLRDRQAHEKLSEPLDEVVGEEISGE